MNCGNDRGLAFRALALAIALAAGGGAAWGCNGAPENPGPETAKEKETADAAAKSEGAPVFTASADAVDQALVLEAERWMLEQARRRAGLASAPTPAAPSEAPAAPASSPSPGGKTPAPSHSSQPAPER